MSYRSEDYFEQLEKEEKIRQEQELAKNQVIELCERLLNKDPNLAEIFLKLEKILWDYNNNESLRSFIRLIASDIDMVPGSEANLSSEEYLLKLRQEELSSWQFYEKDIIEFAYDMIAEMKKKEVVIPIS